MFPSLDSLNVDKEPPHRRRYLAALDDPTHEPLGWLVNVSCVAFNAEHIVSSAISNQLTVDRCFATLRAAAKLTDDAADPLMARLQPIIAACQDASPSYLNEQLMAVELPIMLLQKFDGDSRWLALVDAAIGLLSQRVLEVLDEDGWPGPDVAEDFGPLAASWTRSVALLRSVERSLDEDVLKTLRWLPRQIMRLKRFDQTLMLSSSPAIVPDELLSLMINVLGDADDATIFNRTLDRPSSPKPNLVMLDKTCNTISTWGGSLLFHDGWEKKACRISAEFDSDGCRMEIAKTKSLIRGNVFPELIVDGNPLPVVGQPEVLVEYLECLDRRVAFAEIQWTFENDVVMQRQIILSMEDKFAWIGDAVVTPEDARQAEIEYRCRWDLAGGISTVAESETSEGYFYDGKKMRGLVIPPSFNEWKSGRSAGSLTLGEDHFTMHAKRRGHRLYVPVFIDLSPKRSLKPRTWRQLTVAQSLEIVDGDVAVAYRVHVGKQQFVFYRSMAEPENRTFFGENVNTEMFLGRLEKNRTMTELVQIE